MKHRKILLVLLLILSLALCGCGTSAAAAPTPEPAPEATPQPTPEPTPVPTPRVLTFPDGSQHYDYEIRVDLSELKHEDVPAAIEALKEMPQLFHVDLGQAPLEEGEEPRLLWSDIAAMQEALPGVQVLYRFRVSGYDPIHRDEVYDDYTTLDEVFDLNHIAFDDEGALIREILPCMQNCTFLDMDYCNVSNEAMAQIRDDFPQMEVVWRVWFGQNCSVRTNVERILASNLDHCLADSNASALQYCTKVKYFDVGHNGSLTDFFFLHNMPELEVAIVTLTGMKDLNDFSDCKNLEFLEIAFIKENIDLSPLANLKHLHHLNINYLNYVTGVEALCELQELERLWIGGHTYISEEDLAMLREALPNTQFDTTDLSGTMGSWHTNPDGTMAARYALLRQQFDYDNYPMACAAIYADPRFYARHGE